MWKENDAGILKQHQKTSGSRSWIKMESQEVKSLATDGSKHTPKTQLKWFKDNKVRVLEWPSQRLDLNLMENEAVNEKN